MKGRPDSVIGTKTDPSKIGHIKITKYQGKGRQRFGKECTGLNGSVNGLLDGGGVDRLEISLGAEINNIEDFLSRIRAASNIEERRRGDEEKEQKLRGVSGHSSRPKKNSSITIINDILKLVNGRSY